MGCSQSVLVSLRWGGPARLFINESSRRTHPLTNQQSSVIIPPFRYSPHSVHTLSYRLPKLRPNVIPWSDIIFVLCLARRSAISNAYRYYIQKNVQKKMIMMLNYDDKDDYFLMLTADNRAFYGWSASKLRTAVSNGSISREQPRCEVQAANYSRPRKRSL